MGDASAPADAEDGAPAAPHLGPNGEDPEDPPQMQEMAGAGGSLGLASPAIRVQRPSPPCRPARREERGSFDLMGMPLGRLGRHDRASTESHEELVNLLGIPVVQSQGTLTATAPSLVPRRGELQMQPSESDHTEATPRASPHDAPVLTEAHLSTASVGPVEDAPTASTPPSITVPAPQQSSLHPLSDTQQRPGGASGGAARGPMADDAGAVRDDTGGSAEQDRASDASSFDLGDGAIAGYRLREIFDRLDVKGRNYVTRANLIRALSQDDEVRKLMDLPAQIKQASDAHTDFERLFQLLDRDGDRGITWEDFRDLFFSCTHSAFSAKSRPQFDYKNKSFVKRPHGSYKFHRWRDEQHRERKKHARRASKEAAEAMEEEAAAQHHAQPPTESSHVPRSPEGPSRTSSMHSGHRHAAPEDAQDVWSATRADPGRSPQTNSTRHADWEVDQYVAMRQTQNVRVHEGPGWNDDLLSTPHSPPNRSEGDWDRQDHDLHAAPIPGRGSERGSQRDLRGSQRAFDDRRYEDAQAQRGSQRDLNESRRGHDEEAYRESQRGWGRANAERRAGPYVEEVTSFEGGVTDSRRGGSQRGAIDDRRAVDRDENRRGAHRAIDDRCYEEPRPQRGSHRNLIEGRGSQRDIESQRVLPHDEEFVRGSQRGIQWDRIEDRRGHDEEAYREAQLGSGRANAERRAVPYVEEVTSFEGGVTDSRRGGSQRGAIDDRRAVDRDENRRGAHRAIDDRCYEEPRPQRGSQRDPRGSQRAIDNRRYEDAQVQQGSQRDLIEDRQARSERLSEQRPQGGQHDGLRYIDDRKHSGPPSGGPQRVDDRAAEAESAAAAGTVDSTTLRLLTQKLAAAAEGVERRGGQGAGELAGILGDLQETLLDGPRGRDDSRARKQLDEDDRLQHLFVARSGDQRALPWRDDRARRATLPLSDEPTAPPVGHPHPSEAAMSMLTDAVQGLHALLLEEREERRRDRRERDATGQLTLTPSYSMPAVQETESVQASSPARSEREPANPAPTRLATAYYSVTEYLPVEGQPGQGRHEGSTSVRQVDEVGAEAAKNRERDAEVADLRRTVEDLQAQLRVQAQETAAARRAPAPPAPIRLSPEPSLDYTTKPAAAARGTSPLRAEAPSLRQAVQQFRNELHRRPTPMEVATVVPERDIYSPAAESYRTGTPIPKGPPGVSAGMGGMPPPPPPPPASRGGSCWDRPPPPAPLTEQVRMRPAISPPRRVPQRESPPLAAHFR